MNNVKLDELFSLPVGLQVGAVIGGQKFYTSDKLKKNFVLAFEKSSKGKRIAKSIEELVNKDLILPSYKNKGLLKFFKHKIFSSGEDKYALAMYYVNEKRIIVLIDNNTSVFGTASNNAIVSTTMHECMHLLSGRDMNRFLRIFTPTLREFYFNYYTDIFKLTNKPKSLDKVIGFLAYVESPGGAPINKKLSRLYQLIEEGFKQDSSLNDEQFTRALTDYIVASKILMLSINSFMRVKSKYMYLLNALERAYKKTFRKKNKVSQVFQEMYSVSEVISIMAELTPKDPKIKQAFEIMARG
jgi:hypothetical protein